MREKWRSRATWLAAGVTVGLLGCGPTITTIDGGSAGGDGAAGTGGVTTVPPSNTSVPPPGTTAPPPSTTAPPDSSTTTSDSSTDWHGPTCIFLCPPDGGIGDPCDLWSQDCPEGEKCMAAPNDGTRTWNWAVCAPVDDDPALVGEPCTVEGTPYSGFDDCEFGAMCFYVDPETNEGTCVAMCSGSENNPQCPEQTVCPIGGQPNVIPCLPECNPLLGCDEGQTCVPYADDPFCAATIASPATVGDACMFLNECAPGLVCMPDDSIACEGDSCCTAWCDLGAGAMNNPSCGGAGRPQTCVAWFENGAPQGLENLGICEAA